MTEISSDAASRMALPGSSDAIRFNRKLESFMKSFLHTLLLLLPFAASAAKVEDVEIKSEKLQKSFTCRVVIPGTVPAGTKMAQFYLLHGASDQSDAWQSKTSGAVEKIADDYKRLIVCPTAGPFSWYNSNNGSEDFILKEVIPFIDAHYATLPDRWIAGNSMGGFGALRLGSGHPDLFSAFAGLSPCITPSKWKNWEIPKAMGPDYSAGAFDLFKPAMIVALKTDKRPCVVICGKADFFLAENQTALAACKAAGVDLNWRDTEGAHNWAYWTTQLPLVAKTFRETTKKK